MSVVAPEKPAATESDTDAALSALPVVELSEAELDALAKRISEARAHDLALSAGDYDMLLSALLMLANMHERLTMPSLIRLNYPLADLQILHSA